MTRAEEPTTAAPDERAKPSYRVLAELLRADVEAGLYADGRKLPTELSLMAEHQLSRDTVRRAFRELEIDGYIYRVRGRGTFASAGGPSSSGQYQRTVGSLEDMTSWPNTELEVLQPFTPTDDPAIAAVLKLDGGASVAAVRRHHQGSPFVVTRHYVSRRLGAIAAEHGVPASGETTVIGRLEEFLDAPIMRAEQTLSAIRAEAADAEAILCSEGDPILLVTRLYYDAMQAPVEYTVSHFNPERYTYRTELRRRARPW